MGRSPAIAAADDLQGAYPRNEISYNAAISACEKGKQWEEALRLLQQMTCRTLTPDEISYNAAINACEKGK